MSTSPPTPTAVWVAHSSDDAPLELVRMDPRTGARLASVTIDAEAPDEKHLALGGGAVWVVSEHGVVRRIDPRAGRVVAEIVVGSQHLDGAAYCADALWVSTTGREGGRVARIDARTNAVVGTVPLVYPRALVAAGGALWASHGTRVTRIDPRTLRTTETFDLGGQVHALAADEDAVWAATVDEVAPGVRRAARDSGALFRLVAGVATPVPAARIEGRVDGVCVGASGVWVTAGALLRFEPARGALVTTLDEPLTRPVAVGAGVWASRYEYARDANEVVAFDPAAGALRVLDAQGWPRAFAVE
jgi:hypothetical protein